MIKLNTFNPRIPEDFSNVQGDFSFINSLNQKLTAYNRKGDWNTIRANDYIAYMEY